MTIKKPLSFLLIVLFAAGMAVSPPAEIRAEARIKKVHRKIIRRKHYRQRGRWRSFYPKRTPSGSIIQKYHLERGTEEGQEAAAAEEIRGAGAEAAQFDPAGRVLEVRFNSKKLSAISILTRLKERGYTVTRID